MLLAPSPSVVEVKIADDVDERTPVATSEVRAAQETVEVSRPGGPVSPTTPTTVALWVRFASSVVVKSLVRLTEEPVSASRDVLGLRRSRAELCWATVRVRAPAARQVAPCVSLALSVRVSERASDAAWPWPALSVRLTEARAVALWL